MSAAPAHVDALVREIAALSGVDRSVRRQAGPRLEPLAAVQRRAPARVGDVAEDLQVDVSVASRQIAALVAAGQVERTTDPADARAHRLVLTDAGAAALAGVQARLSATLADATGDWAPEEVEALAATLARLRADYARAAAGRGAGRPRRFARYR